MADQPAGALRRLLRAPRVLYRWHAGWLLGHRFLLLRHTGRRSGAAYRTVLEVVHYDAASGAATCMSGWGAGADWYRNIMAGPVAVTIGRRTFPVVPEVLDPDRAARADRQAAAGELHPAPGGLTRRGGPGSSRDASAEPPPPLCAASWGSCPGKAYGTGQLPLPSRGARLAPAR